MATQKLSALLIIAFLVPASLWAQEKPDQQVAQHRLHEVPLVEVLDAVRRNDDRSFLVDHRVSPSIVIGQADLRDLDYGTLLVILRNNDLAAVNVNDVVNVIPASIVRQYPLPVIAEADDSIHDEEWVTWVIHVENASPGSIVPIIRPIMPAAGHFAANPGSRSMLLVDRYGNAKRIVDIIRQLDDASPPDS